MTEESPRSADRRDDSYACWSCERPVAARAMFCHGCGALQPPRDAAAGAADGDDAFARLGLPRRFDLDPALIDRQHAGFRARLAPERFAGRRLEERGHAARHRDALDRARERLADPWLRALHLLALAGQETEDAADRPLSRDLTLARAGLAEASAPPELDPVIEAAVERLDLLFVDLAAAFQGERFARARELVREIGGWRRFVADARLRRAELAADRPANPLRREP